MRKLTLIIIGLILIHPSQVRADDKEDVTAVIKKLWVDVSNKKVNSSTIFTKGVWQARSDGGLWDFLTPDEVETLINDSPNNLRFRPYHVEVGIIGQNKDVAYANYYLVGTITGPNRKVIASNYRTRASDIFIKENGKWVTVSMHYSPLHGGMGVVLD